MNTIELRSFADSELLHQIAEGDQRAFNYMFEKYERLIFNIAFKLTDSRSKSKEIVQDVFLKVWMKSGDLKHIENLGAYLNRIARNHTIDALRKIAREENRTIQINEQFDKVESNTEDTLNYRETLNILNQAIDSLSPQQKKVYHLCHVHGLKYEEAAYELGISEGTVHSHMKQALANLRTTLKKNEAVLPIILLFYVDRF